MNQVRLSVEISFDLEFSDMVRANLWCVYRKLSTRILLVFVGMLALFACIALASSNERPLAALVLLFCIVYGGLLPLTAWFNARKSYSDLKPFQKHLKYRFTYDGYEAEDGKSSSVLSWDSILRADESKHSFNLFSHRVIFHVVPKRCFQGQDDIQLMRDILKDTFRAKAKLRRD